jgi:hypothetical protein
MHIIPRHLRVLQELAAQKKKDQLGGIGWGALRDEDDPLTYQQLFIPLIERGLIEDLTGTELGTAGKYFVRLTPLGSVCLSMGVMLRAPRPADAAELKALHLPPPATPEEAEIIGNS